LTTGIACFVAVICAIGFIAIWFSTVYHELSEKRRNLDSLREQLQLHKSASILARDGPEQEVAYKMLATNRSIFQESVGNYNKLLKKPTKWLPALLLGFHSVDST